MFTLPEKPKDANCNCYLRMEHKLKAALFDLDGVVIDTESQYTDFWRGVGSIYFPECHDFAIRLKGQTLDFIFQTYFPNACAERERVGRMLAEFEQTMDFPYVPGVESYLEKLKQRNIPTAVVTSSNREKMEYLFCSRPEIRGMFTRIFTAEDSPRSKPAPDCYIHAARQLGVSPVDCWIFEDSFNGLKAARGAGGYVVGLTTSNSASAIQPLCDQVIPDFTQL